MKDIIGQAVQMTLNYREDLDDPHCRWGKKAGKPPWTGAARSFCLHCSEI
jgi:hypothetical protein